MKKLFISCPMRGRSNESILASIEQMHKIAEAIFGEELEVVQTHVIMNEPPRNADERLWHLGNSIQKMATADYFIGVYDADKENYGCIIENHVAKLYGVPQYLVDIKYIAPDVMEERDSLWK